MKNSFPDKLEISVSLAVAEMDGEPRGQGLLMLPGCSIATD